MNIFEKYANYHTYAKTDLNLGNTHRKLKKFDNAEKYLFDGLTRIQNNTDRYWEGITCKCIGLLYMDQGNKTLAKKYLNKASKFLNQLEIKKK